MKKVKRKISRSNLYRFYFLLIQSACEIKVQRMYYKSHSKSTEVTLSTKMTVNPESTIVTYCWEQ